MIILFKYNLVRRTGLVYKCDATETLFFIVTITLMRRWFNGLIDAISTGSHYEPLIISVPCGVRIATETESRPTLPFILSSVFFLLLSSIVCVRVYVLENLGK